MHIKISSNNLTGNTATVVRGVAVQGQEHEQCIDILKRTRNNVVLL